jgi:two-component system chemotaxis response regulator CheB
MTMPRVRVLMADDSVVVRKLLSGVLAEENELEVVGTAADGEILLQKIPQTNPDVVILDVEMPNVDGLETLRRLRTSYPDLPVIMFSNLTRRGADATIEALLLGAQDCVPKPESSGSFEESVHYVREMLIPKIKVLGKASLEKSSTHGPLTMVKSFVDRKAGVLLVGVSTGGPNALSVLLGRIPKEFPIPVAVVQHMPALFTEALATRLAYKTGLCVREARDGESFVPGVIFLAPGDFHLGLVRQSNGVNLRVFKSEPVHSCRPSVDVLFKDAVQVFGPDCLGVILTGMGLDGLAGCEGIHHAGGQVLVQDEASSVVWGMPGAVAQAGLANAILPLDQMASEILSRVRNPLSRLGFP